MQGRGGHTNAPVARRPIRFGHQFDGEPEQPLSSGIAGIVSKMALKNRGSVCMVALREERNRSVRGAEMEGLGLEGSGAQGRSAMRV